MSSNLSALNYFDRLKFSNSDFIRAATLGGEFLLFSFSTTLQAMLAWSDNISKVLGVIDQDVLIGSNFILRHVDLRDRFRVMQLLEDTIAHHTPFNCTYRWIRPDNNQLIWINCRAQITEDADGVLLEGVIFDISKQVEIVQQQTNLTNTRCLLEAFADTLILLDDQLKIIATNGKLEAISYLFNRTEIAQNQLQSGLSIETFLHLLPDGDSLLVHIQAVLNADILSYKDEFIISENVAQLHIVPLLQNHIKIGVLLIITDISTQFKNNNKLAQLEYLKDLQQVGLSVLHSLNNNLQAILGATYLIEKRPKDICLLRNSTKTIISSVDMAAELTNQLQELQQLSYDNKEADLNYYLLTSIGKLLKAGFKGDRIICSLGAVEKFSNSACNFESIIEKIILVFMQQLQAEDLIEISTQTEQVTKNKKLDEHKNISKASLRIAYRNNSNYRYNFKQVNEKIKSLLLEDKPHIFRAYLPNEPAKCLLKLVFNCDEKHSKEVEPFNPNALETIQANQSVILVVDDDHLVLQTLNTMLANLGYSCITADNEITALSKFKRFKSKLVLVMVDAIIPGTSGENIIRQLKRSSNGIPIIGLSGSDNLTRARLIEAGAMTVIRKPIGVKMLGNIIKQHRKASVINNKN